VPEPSARLESICVYCGSSEGAPTAWRAAATDLGRILANQGLRLVYGGGGVGLMGECARSARAAGGSVLGVIPAFLVPREAGSAGADTMVVKSMHERKLMMFEQADGFAILPGAIGTLEEVVELLSWRRLALHAKPIVFFNPDGFWDPLFDLFGAFIEQRMLPGEFDQCWRAVTEVRDILPALRAMPSSAMRTIPVIATLI